MSLTLLSKAILLSRSVLLRNVLSRSVLFRLSFKMGLPLRMSCKMRTSF